MSDETNYGTGSTENAGTTERVGFCQDCGTPLTRETARTVGSGAFCEPCLATRVGTTTTGQAGYTTVPPAGSVPPAGAVPVAANTLPHPVLAGFLGLIPGVGAMYNGQYAKGIAHLVVFAVLASLSDHVNGIFGLLLTGWVFYQVFDAYHTASARLEGRPLPNPFGLNEVGERIGFNWHPGAAGSAAGAAPSATAAGQPTGPAWAETPVQPPPSGYSATGYAAPAYSAPSYNAPPAGPVNSGPDWVGYVPPTNFAYGPPMPPAGGTPSGAAWGQAPYAATYTGAGDPSFGAGVPVLPPTHRFPVGAIWLIGLGVVFLLFEFGQQWGWSLNFNWALALLFAGLAALALVRRMVPGVPVLGVLRGPVMLATLAVLFMLQALNIADLGRTWPVLFIAFGGMLVAERAAASNARFAVPVYPAGGSVVPPMEDAERTRAAWAASAASAAENPNDVMKGGQ